jgi:hypothetical protein
MTHDQLLEYIRHRITEAGSLRKFAKSIGESAGLISNILTKHYPVNKMFLSRIGMYKTEIYLKKEG